MKKVKSYKPHQPRKPFKCVEGIGSETWRKLRAHDQMTLIMFYETFNGWNRNRLSLPFLKVRGRISKPTFFKSIQRLIAFGFLYVVKKGRINPDKTYSIYGLSDSWRKFEKKPADLDRIEKLLEEAEVLKNSHIQKQRNKRRVILRSLGLR